MAGFHFALPFFALIYLLIYAVLLLGGGFVAGYGFRKGWDRAAARRTAEPPAQG